MDGHAKDPSLDRSVCASMREGGMNEWRNGATASGMEGRDNAFLVDHQVSTRREPASVLGGDLPVLFYKQTYLSGLHDTQQGGSPT